MTDQNTPGPLSQAEITELWQSSVDDLFAQPLIEQGEGFGLEAYTQGHAQFARVSQAIDVAMQSLYINAWSGQTNPPASGEAFATVTLTLTRSGLLTNALTLKAGQFSVQETTTDWSPSGPLTVMTGRNYIIQSDVNFGVSDQGPYTVLAQAEFVGVGYNNPLPDTLGTPNQPGTNFFNENASVTLATSPTLVVANEPDVVIPQHVGQYVLFTAGANTGTIKRIVSYAPPQPSPGIFPSNGGSVVLDSSSGLNPEVLTASWRILDWVNDWGINVTNSAQPTGGKLGLLDVLGAERNIYRGPGETDASFAKRISKIADVVTPNAIQRAANRILEPYNLTCVLYEVGAANFPGFFYDGDPYSTDPNIAFAYDMGPRGYGPSYNSPRDDLKVYVSFEDMRGYFMIGVPQISLGEFGFAYDAGPSNAYDCSPYDAFYDGYPVGTGELYLNIFNSVNLIKAGGVGFDMYLIP